MPSSSLIEAEMKVNNSLFIYEENQYWKSLLLIACFASPVSQIYNNTFSKNKSEEISRYLEPNGKNRNSTLAYVDITSDASLVTWAEMSPKIISDEFVTIKEYNMESKTK